MMVDLLFFGVCGVAWFFYCRARKWKRRFYAGLKAHDETRRRHQETDAYLADVYSTVTLATRIVDDHRNDRLRPFYLYRADEAALDRILGRSDWPEEIERKEV